MSITKLYHGSGYLHNELKPGYMHTGQEVFWDETESNRYLYATIDREEAIELGFASAVEKAFLLNRFQSDGNKYTFTFEDKVTPKLSDLEKLVLYIYDIKYADDSGWKHVNNQTNGIDTEYKTDKVIESALIIKTEKVNLKDWLSDKEIIIKSSKPKYTKW